MKYKYVQTLYWHTIVYSPECPPKTRNIYQKTLHDSSSPAVIFNIKTLLSKSCPLSSTQFKVKSGILVIHGLTASWNQPVPNKVGCNFEKKRENLTNFHIWGLRLAIPDAMIPSAIPINCAAVYQYAYAPTLLHSWQI